MSGTESDRELDRLATLTEEAEQAGDIALAESLYREWELIFTCLYPDLA